MTRRAISDIDSKTATVLGFPKLEYVAVERERRWLCRAVPCEQVVRTEAITDLYVAGTRLRLRETRPIDGGAPMLRLSRKVRARNAALFRKVQREKKKGGTKHPPSRPS